LDFGVMPGDLAVGQHDVVRRFSPDRGSASIDRELAAIGGSQQENHLALQRIGGDNQI
jgi:hypothetical protein